MDIAILVVVSANLLWSIGSTFFALYLRAKENLEAKAQIEAALSGLKGPELKADEFLQDSEKALKDLGG